MITKKRRSQKQEKSVAKDFNAKTTIASGAKDVAYLEVSGKVISIDTEDLSLISDYYLKIPKGGIYVIAREPMKNGNRKSIALSRLLLGVTDNNVLVDHKDRNTLNYCKDNLRVCTRSQNQANRVFRGDYSSKYKGVSFDRQTSKWKVSMKYKRQSIHGGYFDNEDEAGLKYNELAKKYFGEFAVLNIIGGDQHE